MTGQVIQEVSSCEGFTWLRSSSRSACRFWPRAASIVSRPDLATVMARSAKMTRAELITQMERDPKSMAIVTPHGLKAKDYVYGVPALRMAMMAAQGLSGPTVVASPANVAFAKANLALLKPKMEAAEGRGRQ